MGYNKERQAYQRKGRAWKVAVAFAVVLISLGLIVLNSFIPARQWKYRLFLPNIETRRSGELRVHFLDISNGSATIIELPDGKAVLLDGGNGESTTKILRYLNALKIEKLDAVVLTNNELKSGKGLSEILSEKPTDVFFSIPDLFEDVGFNGLKNTLENGGTEQKVAEIGKTVLSSDEYKLVCLSPTSSQNPTYGELTKDEKSVVLCLEYGGHSIAFLGNVTEAVLHGMCLRKNQGVYSFLSSPVLFETVQAPKYGAVDLTELIETFSVQSVVIPSPVSMPTYENVKSYSTEKDAVMLTFTK